MAKKYIEGETKEQRKARKAKEKLAKAQKSVETQKVLPQENVEPQPVIKHSTSNDRHILCLKWGKKYDATYVNRLYNMVTRNCTIPFTFSCLTDDARGLHKNINVLPLPKLNASGWWYKPYIFSKELPLKGTILYLDLDVVISGNIDKLFSYQENKWCTIIDFTRVMRPKWNRYNSSVVRFEAGTLSHVWDEYQKDPKGIQKRFFGDQDYLWDATNKVSPAQIFPRSWIQSWKWEIRKSKELVYGLPKGSRKLKVIEDVTPNPECCICVFHGDPNPHNCEDPWVVENWK